jgi:hypothetical protein
MHGAGGHQRDAAENDQELLEDIPGVTLQVQKNLGVYEEDERLQNEQKSKQVFAPLDLAPSLAQIAIGGASLPQTNP